AALAGDDDQHWALVPFRMQRCDHRGLGDVGVGHRDILQRYRADPFATGFDNVFGTIGDFHHAVEVDGGDVAGGEPAIRVERAAGLVTIIGVAYPRAAHFQVAERDAIPGQFLAVAVDDFH